MPQISDNQLLVFGGLNKGERYNDVWVLDVEARVWSKAEVEGLSPEPRAHFTATLVKFRECIFIFGGYGGSGQVFNDMWLLHYAAGGLKWENVTELVQVRRGGGGHGVVGGGAGWDRVRGGMNGLGRDGAWEAPHVQARRILVLKQMGGV